MTEITRDGQDERTLLSFIWTKVKNCDNADSVHIGEFCGLPALCFDEVYGDTLYQTSVYLYDGWVYELFCETGVEFEPQDGVRIISVNDFSFEEYGYGIIKVSSGAKSLLIYPRGDDTGGGAGMESGEGGFPA
jgi:hypothetical protein